MSIILHPKRVLDVKKGVYIQKPYISISNGTINKITREPQQGIMIDLPNMTLLPGLIDTHVHITYCFPNESEGLKSNAFKTLKAGFTTVRDLGITGTIETLLKFIDSPNPQPRILTSGKPISKSDTSSTPVKVLLEQRHKSHVIKIFENEKSMIGKSKLKEIVESTNKPVAIHAGEVSEIHNAILSECCTIEHCTHIDDANIELIKGTNIRICPTLYLPTNYLNNWKDYLFMFRGFEKEAKEHFIRMEKYCIPNLKRAYERRANFVFGTDAVAGMHGNNWMEFESMLKLGMTPLEAIQCATIYASEVVARGPYGIKYLGEIVPGFKADIIGCVGDPLNDITCLSKIDFVMKDGTIFFNSKQ